MLLYAANHSASSAPDVAAQNAHRFLLLPVPWTAIVPSLRHVSGTWHQVLPSSAPADVHSKYDWPLNEKGNVQAQVSSPTAEANLRPGRGRGAPLTPAVPLVATLPPGGGPPAGPGGTPPPPGGLPPPPVGGAGREKQAGRSGGGVSLFTKNNLLEDGDAPSHRSHSAGARGRTRRARLLA